jgi:oxygen-dependent protoporphyrinogen oxidase
MMTSTSSTPTLRVAIIGGGITGMSAAFYLEQAAQAAGIKVDYTLIERNQRLGGKIASEYIDDFVVEGGPDSFLTQKPWGMNLARDLGLESSFQSTKPAKHPTYVLVDGKPVPMPAGMSLIVPSQFLPFARSPIMSTRGKLRLALDLLIPPKRDKADETMADFVRRRLGSEALERLAEPLLAGIHSSEPERQSILATFPRFRDLEAQYGSLLRGSIAQRLAMRRAKTNGRPVSPFVTLRGGVGELVRTLETQLNGRLIRGQGVAALNYTPNEDAAYRVLLENGETIDADAVIMATPAYTAAHLVSAFRPSLAASLRKIRYVSTGTLTLAYRTGDVGALLDGYGLVIPQRAKRRINAITIMSSKFDNRAPQGFTQIRVFLGGSRNPDVLQLEDSAIEELARAELRDILGITATPLWSRIFRWMNGNPQYDVGHLAHVDALDALCTPGLYLAGSAYRGVGIPDCVRQGQLAADAAVAFGRERLSASQSS